MRKFQWMRKMLYMLLVLISVCVVLDFVSLSTIKVRPTKQFAEMYVDEGDVLDFNTFLCPHEKYNALLQIDSDMREKVAEYMKRNDYKLKSGHQEFIRSNLSFEELIDSGFEFEQITEEDKVVLSSIHTIDISKLQERKYEQKFYSDISSECFSENNIKIVYPQFSEDSFGTNTSQVNELIKKEAISVLKLYEDDADDVSIDASYAITYRDDKTLSIIFLGTADISIIKHTDDLFWTLNVDLKKGEKLYLSDIVPTNRVEEIIESKNYIFKVYKDEGDTFFCKVSDYVQKDMLDQCDIAGSGVYSYFTEKCIGVSFSVPYSYGGHKEIELSFELFE